MQTDHLKGHYRYKLPTTKPTKAKRRRAALLPHLLLRLTFPVQLLAATTQIRWEVLETGQAVVVLVALRAATVEHVGCGDPLLWQLTTALLVSTVSNIEVGWKDHNRLDARDCAVSAGATLLTEVSNRLGSTILAHTVLSGCQLEVVLIVDYLMGCLGGVRMTAIVAFAQVWCIGFARDLELDCATIATPFVGSHAARVYVGDTAAGVAESADSSGGWQFV